MSPKTLKCVVVGDGAVGKTCLLIRYEKGEFPLGYIPTIFDNYVVTLSIAGENYDLHLFDTAGQEDYDQLRKLTFDNTDIFIVCFSVTSWSSFVNIREKWVPELLEYSPGVPYILVGTQTDLRYDQGILEKLIAQGRHPILEEQGKKLAKELKAVKYVECSALTKENVNDVFQEAIYTAISYSPASSVVINIPPNATSDKHNVNVHNNNNNVKSNCCTNVKNSISKFCPPINVCSIL